MEVARSCAAHGRVREAEGLLRAVRAREPKNLVVSVLLDDVVAGRMPAPEGVKMVDLTVVDAWIRNGWLVEALLVLASGELGGPSREWAELLGELLAPVPAHAEDVFVEMHAHLLSGGASVALALLEDRKRISPFPSWAQRRLQLLRWMLLDNALSLPEEGHVEALTQLAQVLEGPLGERSLVKALAAVQAYAERSEDADARACEAHLQMLVEEVAATTSSPNVSVKTVAVDVRHTASLQLMMANFDAAGAIYRAILNERPGDPIIAPLYNATQAVLLARMSQPVPAPLGGDDDDDANEETLSDIGEEPTMAASRDAVLAAIGAPPKSALSPPSSREVTEVTPNPSRDVTDVTLMPEAAVVVSPIRFVGGP